jgi:hypothetical protein
MNNRIQLAIVASIALLLPCRASAAFTDRELTSILHLHEARASLEEALMHHLAQLVSAYTTPATRPRLGRAMSKAVAAYRELSMCEALLVGVVTEQVKTPGYAKLAAMPRSDRLRLAWWRLDRFVMLAKAAQDELAAATSLLADLAYRDGLRRARDIWLRRALSEAAAVDRGLAYADPNPASHPKIIGPHGDYDRTQWFLWRSHWYALDALENLLAAYVSEPPVNSPGLGDAFMRIGEALRLLMQSLELVAGVTWTPEQRQSSQFFRVLGVTKLLTDHGHVPFRWMEALVSLRTHWFPHLHGRPVVSSNIQDAMIRIADAWKHSDMAAWEIMTFPGCDPAVNPQGCGGTRKRQPPDADDRGLLDRIAEEMTP